MNISNNTDDGSDHRHVHLRVSTVGAVIYVAVYTPVVLMCIGGNSLVMASFLRFRKVRKINNYYLFTLSVVDFLTGLVAMPLAISNRLIISETTCHASTRSFLFLPAYVLLACSMCLLLAITIDRYIAVSRPLRYHVIMTPRRTSHTILFWLCFGMCFGTLPLWSFGGDPYQWVCELEQYEAPIVTIHAIVSSTLIPTWLFLLIAAYGRIFYIAYLRKDTLSESRSQRGKSVQWRMRMRTTVTSAIVLGTFTVLWVPHSFKNIFEIYLARDLKSLLAVQTVCEMLTYINSFMNPIIYGWRNQQFRTAYKEILNGCGCNLGNELEKTPSCQNTDESGSNTVQSVSAISLH